ncbi:MAG: zinc-dependent metalloprotease [Phycisphaeraceae bacterium]|nr:MAG: zinc-dependent metalloprotease [Phycisphaeraceae bacterium]
MSYGSARRWAVCAAAGLAAALSGVALGQDAEEKFPAFTDVSKGYERVGEEGQSFYNVWVDRKKGQMLAELPRGFENQRHFVALTVASGEEYAGLQAGDILVYWKRFDRRLMLIEPNIETKSTGDAESKASVKRLFTDRVILDVPIVCMGPNGQPVIDMDQLLAGRASTFFGRGGNASLATIKTAKAFPENVELSFEMPTGGGRLQTFHYSISLLRDNPAYKPREADERVGYFTTTHRDLGKFTDKEKWVRYINRWHLEKRDPRLKLSPPKQPIVFYIESAVPVRYRRWVERGVLDWNKAYEKVGILGAIEVRQQDAETGAHMDKDPEDVRYNFIRWLSNDIGTAIGPSRVNPNTGEILDADVILTDGWIRHFWVNYNDVLPQIAMEGMSAETLAWLDRNPEWDPRVRLAPPEQRDYIIAQRARRGVSAYGGHPIATAAAQGGRLVGRTEYDGLLNRTSQVSGLCFAAGGKAFDVAMMRMHLEVLGLDSGAGLTGSEAAESGSVVGSAGGKADLLDGIPDWFIGPLLQDLVAHEVGHTLGLRHNFKASTIYGLDKINSPEVKGQKPFTGSVMDYNPINMNIPTAEALAKAASESKDGDKKKDPAEVRPQEAGDYTMIDIGAYDYWAIEYGYTFGDTKEVLKRVAEPELVYGTDEDTSGPDPRARRYDFGADPLEYAKNQVELAGWHRARLLDSFVKDGESWSKARRGYEMTLAMQTRSVGMMANWVGGAFVNRDRKGDPNARPPVTPVPAAQQRAALKFVIDQAFRDESFGLTPELLAKMTADKWLDAGGMSEAMQEPAWPVHDRISGVQASALTQLMNPTTLRRVYDNEFRVPADQDALTLPEVFETVFASIWTELDGSGSGSTARKPMVSSLRRNLQREHLNRLVDLSMSGMGRGAASKPIGNLATMQLRQLKEKLDRFKTASIDPYTKSHFDEARVRIEKALDAQYIFNAGGLGGGGGGMPFFFGVEPETPRIPDPGNPRDENP